MDAHAPTLATLARDFEQLVLDAPARTTDVRGGLNAEGGDPLLHGDPRLLARHLGHYLAAAELAQAVGYSSVSQPSQPSQPIMLDVGCGTGLFSGWLRARLGGQLHLADHDQAVLDAARAATGAAAGTTAVADAAPAQLVTAMEVLEHLPPSEQPAFCAALLAARAPGGTLILSTPDESLYPGGWSGYAPHVGCVTAATLRGLLEAAGAREISIWRIVGGPYDTSARRRMAEACGNRAWRITQRVAPSFAATLERRAGDRRGAAPTLDTRVFGDVRVMPATEGAGGSLLAVVQG
ncbi:MAG: SAM-dependent methyltransferase [Nitriliruptoraceae bacterium]|jgi:SAM-dependent methyltransferase